MKRLKFIIFLLFTANFALGQSEPSDSTAILDSIPRIPIYEFEQMADGIDLCETWAPKMSKISDSRITIIRLNPSKLNFYLLSATERCRLPRTAKQWADTFSLNLVFNAGMYSLANGMIHRGYLKTNEHYNNPVFNTAYNSMIALNPKDSLDARFRIIDLKCDEWASVKSDYHCYAQGMRMIDCNGEALGWNKKNQSCSMLVAASDPKNNIYLIFSRSPYTHNEMIGFMKSMPFELTNAIYLEGGPETSIYLENGDTCLEKVGSYVSHTYATDDNSGFWPLPNVIGVRVK